MFDEWEAPEVEAPASICVSGLAALRLQLSKTGQSNSYVLLISKAADFSFLFFFLRAGVVIPSGCH